MKLRSFSPDPHPLSYLGSPQGRDIHLGEPTSSVSIASSHKSGITRVGSRSTINAGVTSAVVRMQDPNGPVSYIVSPEPGKLKLADPTAVVRVERDAHGVITPRVVQGNIRPQDLRSGFFIENQAEWFVVVVDEGIGEDEAIDAVARMVVSDTGVGYDEAISLVSHVLSDTGVGIDYATIAPQFTFSDMGVGADAPAVAPKESVFDAGVGADLATSTPSPQAVDTGVGSDSSWLSYLILGTGADLAAGSDSAALTVSELVFDAATGFDIANGTPLELLADNGVGSDGSALNAALASVDLAAGSDKSWLSYLVEPSASDLAAAADAATDGFTPTAETTQQVSLVGPTLVSIKVWCRYIDIVLVGGGNGGGGGWAAGVTGGGGNAGTWNSVTLERGVDIPWTTTVISITIPVIAAGGTPGNKSNGGGAVTASATGWSAGLSAAGGTGDQFGSTRAGQSPGSHTRNGKTYNGGAVQNTNAAPGNLPGGGGNGGNGGVFSGTAGGAGGLGGGWVRCYQ